MSVFRGSFVALPTPFREGAVDFVAFRRLIERQLHGGTDGIVVAGSTGVGAALTHAERLALVEYAKGVVRRRVPLVAGLGSGATLETAALALEVQRLGADGLLVSTPSYTRPTQDGLIRHFDEIARNTALPVILYNIPARTAVDLLPETVARIVERKPNVIAIKEASDSLERLHELVSLDCLDVLCGEDRWIADSMELGAKGVIGVVGNLVPREVARLVHAFDEGEDAGRAPAILESLNPLIRALSREPNPSPLKAALELLGLCGGELRLPLVSVRTETREALRVALDV